METNLEPSAKKRQGQGFEEDQVEVGRWSVLIGSENWRIHGYIQEHRVH